MHCRFGSATLSQLDFPGESDRNFFGEKSQLDNTVEKNNSNNNIKNNNRKTPPGDECNFQPTNQLIKPSTEELLCLSCDRKSINFILDFCHVNDVPFSARSSDDGVSAHFLRI